MSVAVPAPLVVPGQDLDAHHGPLLLDLQAAAARVIASGRYILGPEVAAFERACAERLGVAHAVGVSSGTDALLAALMAAGVGPGDEVVTTPFSFFATVGAIARLGARPVFADIDPQTFNLDPVAAAERVGKKTKAIITVHLFGRRAPTVPLRAACDRVGALLIEDAAQAIGLPWADGDAATLSFFPSKNLGGFGDGGMVLTPDARFAERLRLVRAHGAQPKYHHEVVGGNFRLDELQAALLRVKLPWLTRWTEARQALAVGYHRALSDQGLHTKLTLPPPDGACVWNQYVVRIPNGDRDRVARGLADAGIATAVYYPEPLHLQPCFAHLGHRAGDFPIAEQACAEVLALPMYPELSLAAVAHVAAVLAALLV